MERQRLKDLAKQIAIWADAKGITSPDSAMYDRQMLKLEEETGELAGAILRQNDANIDDGLGDAFVVLTVLGEILGKPMFVKIENLKDEYQNLVQMPAHWVLSGIKTAHYEDRVYYLLALAAKLGRLERFADIVQGVYDIISKRKGATVGGVFIKQGDN